MGTGFQDRPLDSERAEKSVGILGVLRAKVSTWWTIMRIALEERLVYRGDFALGTLMRFLPIITQIFLWSAIFMAIGGGDMQGQEIKGFTINTMIAYYLLTMMSRAFSSMPFDNMGRPQHRTPGTTTRNPRLSRTLTAALPSSGWL